MLPLVTGFGGGSVHPRCVHFHETAITALSAVGSKNNHPSVLRTYFWLESDVRTSFTLPTFTRPPTAALSLFPTHAAVTAATPTPTAIASNRRRNDHRDIPLFIVAPFGLRCPVWPIKRRTASFTITILEKAAQRATMARVCTYTVGGGA